MNYDGWTNYETWAVKLWLDNKHGSYLDMTERATELYREATEDSADMTADELADAELSAASDMADYVQSTLGEDNPLADQASVFTDLLNAALAKVNYREIGESYINDAKESAE